MRAHAMLLVSLALVASGCATAGGGATPAPFPRPGGRSERAEPAAPVRATVAAIIDTALSLTGTPYRNGGSDPSGFDCSGFVQYVFGRHGVPVPRLVIEQFQAGAVVNSDAVEPGDLLFFSTIAPGASHVAIAVGDQEFVHAPSSQGWVRVERVDAEYWRRRFIGAKRIAPAP